MSNANKDSRRQIMRGLGIDEGHDFPLSQYASVRTNCYNYGLEWGKKFSTKINKEARTVTVLRKA